MQQQLHRPWRARGTGSIIRRRQRSGAVALWGKFTVHGEQRWVKLGAERQPGSKLGLTKAQAEAALRRAFEAPSLEQPLYERLEIQEAWERYIDRLESLGRKKTTIADYRSTLRVHLTPFFGGRSLDRINVQFGRGAHRRQAAREQSTEVDIELRRASLLDLHLCRETRLGPRESRRSRRQATERAPGS
jgi:hypothetical protein